MTTNDFKLFLTALRDEAGAKLCGSMARGDYDIDHFSDIDLIVRGRKYKTKKRKMLVAIDIFNRFEVPGESILMGQWSSPRDKITLPRPVEIMEDTWIKPDPALPLVVSLFTVDFQTYRR